MTAIGDLMLRMVGGRLQIIWAVAIAFLFLGSVLDFTALGLTREIVVTTLGGWSLVVSAILAIVILNEPCTKYDIAGICFIMTGMVCSIVSSSHYHRDWTISRIEKQYNKRHVVLAFICMLIAVVSCSIILCIDYVHRIRRSKEMKAKHVVKPKSGGVVGVLICFLASLSGNFVIVFGKAVSVLVKSFLSGDKYHQHPIAVPLLFALIAALLIEISLVNASLSINESLFHIPVYYVFWVIGSVVTGGVFYDELKWTTPGHMYLFIVGLFLLFTGVLCSVLGGRERETSTHHMRKLYKDEMKGLEPGDGIDSSIHGDGSVPCGSFNSDSEQSANLETCLVDVPPPPPSTCSSGNAVPS